MKTSTTIKALAYPVRIMDKRTGEQMDDTVVLDKSWLQICGNCNRIHLMVESVVNEGKMAAQAACK